MRTCCLINHYNYGKYVAEAVESVLAQSRPFDEVVLVDDGSNDGSRAVVEQLQQNHAGLTVIYKNNGGQLSCFNEGFAASDADLFCFLDADDTYEPGYLETLLAAYDANPSVGFVVTHHRKVRPESEEPVVARPDRDLGYSRVRALHAQGWVGGPTSCLSLRRGVLGKILPLPFAGEWRTRADDCLVFGASVAGARKYFLGTPLVRYRLHGANYFQERTRDAVAVYERRVAVNRLLQHMLRKMGYGEGLDNLAHREFRTLEKPTRKEYRAYRGIAWRSGLPLTRKIGMLASMAGYYYFRSDRG